MGEFQPNQRTLENHPFAFVLLREVAQQARVDDPKHHLQRHSGHAHRFIRRQQLLARMSSPYHFLRRETYAALVKNSSRIRRNRIQQLRILRRTRSAHHGNAVPDPTVGMRVSGAIPSRTAGPVREAENAKPGLDLPE